MPMRVEAPPTVFVRRLGQEASHGRLQLFKKDQILGPICLVLVYVDLPTRSSVCKSSYILHVLAHPYDWVRIKLICFVHIR